MVKCNEVIWNGDGEPTHICQAPCYTQHTHLSIQDYMRPIQTNDSITDTDDHGNAFLIEVTNED